MPSTPITTYQVPRDDVPSCPWDAAQAVTQWLDTGGNGTEYLTRQQKDDIRDAVNLVAIYSQA